MGGEKSTRQPSRVLIVDDQRDARQTLAELLEMESYEVAEAGDGHAAWEYLVARQQDGRLPDVLLLDLMMPGMNGWEFRERQLADGRFRQIPILVVSGADRTEQSLSRLGAVEYFVKPIDLDRLLATMRELKVEG